VETKPTPQGVNPANPQTLPPKLSKAARRAAKEAAKKKAAEAKQANRASQRAARQARTQAVQAQKRAEVASNFKQQHNASTGVEEAKQDCRGSIPPPSLDLDEFIEPLVAKFGEAVSSQADAVDWLNEWNASHRARAPWNRVVANTAANAAHPVFEPEDDELKEVDAEDAGEEADLVEMMEDMGIGEVEDVEPVDLVEEYEAAAWLEDAEHAGPAGEEEEDSSESDDDEKGDEER
jgi:hypothetical protein